jgi:hypothetical protein
MERHAYFWVVWKSFSSWASDEGDVNPLFILVSYHYWAFICRSEMTTLQMSRSRTSKPVPMILMRFSFFLCSVPIPSSV